MEYKNYERQSLESSVGKTDHSVNTANIIVSSCENTSNKTASNGHKNGLRVPTLQGSFSTIQVRRTASPHPEQKPSITELDEKSVQIPNSQSFTILHTKPGAQKSGQIPDGQSFTTLHTKPGDQKSGQIPDSQSFTTLHRTHGDVYNQVGNLKVVNISPKASTYSPQLSNARKFRNKEAQPPPVAKKPQRPGCAQKLPLENLPPNDVRPSECKHGPVVRDTHKCIDSRPASPRAVIHEEQVVCDQNKACMLLECNISDGGVIRVDRLYDENKLKVLADAVKVEQLSSQTVLASNLDKHLYNNANVEQFSSQNKEIQHKLDKHLNNKANVEQLSLQTGVSVSNLDSHLYNTAKAEQFSSQTEVSASTLDKHFSYTVTSDYIRKQDCGQSIISCHSSSSSSNLEINSASSSSSNLEINSASSSSSNPEITSASSSSSLSGILNGNSSVITNVHGPGSTGLVDTEMSRYKLPKNFNRLSKSKDDVRDLINEEGSSLLAVFRKDDEYHQKMNDNDSTSSNELRVSEDPSSLFLSAHQNGSSATAGQECITNCYSSSPDSESSARVEQACITNCYSNNPGSCSSARDEQESVSNCTSNSPDTSTDSDVVVDGLGEEDNFNLYVNVKEVFGAIISSLPVEPAQDGNKRLPSTPNYENWTINSAVTSKNRHFYSFSDDDELSDSITPPSTLKHTHPNSGDNSGLTDTVDTTSTDNSSHQRTDIPGRFADGQKNDQQENSSVAHEDKTFSERIYYETNLDDEVPSNLPFVLEPVQRRTKRDKDSAKRRISADRLSALSTDTLSVPSDGDEEASTPGDTSYDEIDSAQDGILKMRQLLVKGVLDSEKAYLSILSVLIDYKRLLEACSQSSQPVISRDDIQAIFSDIETVNDIHTEFVKSLEPKVRNWNHGEMIGEIFEMMISKLTDFGNYLNNYHVAVSTIHKCCQESEQFAKLAGEITVISTTKEKTSLEDALFKPVQRVQRNTLVLHDLIKYTPVEHPDYKVLQDTLKLSQQIIEKFATSMPQTRTTQENRRLVKSSFLVELVGNARKLRYLFLFSDVLICTKRETGRNNKTSFDIKWFAPLSGMCIDTQIVFTDDAKTSKKDGVEELKTRLKVQKKELKAEIRKSDDKDKHRTLASLSGGTARGIEKLKKKVHQTEAQLILAYPRLPFKVLIEGGKSYTLLMSTDYEREEWRETVVSLTKKFSRSDQTSQFLSSIQVQELVNSVKETPQVNKIGNVLLEKDEDILTGILNVTIHKVNGLTEICDTYCNIEMDSYGHFFFKAKTTLCKSTRDPAWNEDFDLELEGSQTLRVLCFKKFPGNQGDKLLGRGALELGKHWLKGSFQEKTLSMNEISLVISLRYTPVDKTMQRTPSRTHSAVFGVSISSCAKRECKTMPTIVTACVQEVERRGIDEVGIYRVSGVSSELQNIKKLMDKNVRSGIMVLQDVDIHAVTGVLKMYLRELPEPLFTEAYYQRFIDTLKLSDEEAKTQCMLSLLHALPDTNYYTAVYLLEHLIKVARSVGENKMSIHNLATIFGPTLLAPASKPTSADPLEVMFKGAEQVMLQSSVISFFLGLSVSGKNLRRSEQ